MSFKNLPYTASDHFRSYEDCCAQDTAIKINESVMTREEYDELMIRFGPQPIHEYGEGFYYRHPSFNVVPGPVIWDTDLTEFTKDPNDVFCGMGPYGVVDNPAQFFELIGEKLRKSERWFCIQLQQITKKDDTGWRWHKWGPYYGKQEPQCEHIGDEPVIEEVWIFHIYEIPSPANPEPRDSRSVMRKKMNLPAEPRHGPKYEPERTIMNASDARNMAEATQKQIDDATAERIVLQMLPAIDIALRGGNTSAFINLGGFNATPKAIAIAKHKFVDRGFGATDTLEEDDMGTGAHLLWVNWDKSEEKAV